MLLDRYEDYQVVSAPQDVVGNGNRVYHGPLEEPAPVPKPVFLRDDLPVTVRTVRAPVQLRLVKVEKALYLSGKLIINTATGRLLLDSARKISADGGPDDVARTAAEVSPQEIARAQAEARRVDGYTFCAASRHGGYGHFLLEALSQLWAAPHLELDSMRFLINKAPHGYNVPLLTPFGMDSKNVIETRTSKRPLPPLLFDNLVVATQACSLPRGISSEFWSAPRTVADYYGSERTASSRLYLSRAHARKRRVTNEAAVEELFRRHGFEIVHPERVEPARQVELYAGAQWIAGPVGSAMYNAVFASREVKRIILAPVSFLTPVDMLISRAEAPYYFFSRDAGHSRDTAMVTDWTVDLPELSKSLVAVFG